MKELTRRQENILDYIKSFYRKRGIPPTVRELGDKFKMKSSSMFDHLNALEKKGYIKRIRHQSRGIRLTEFLDNKMLFANMVSIPVLGRVSAGKLLLAVENIDGSIVINKEWFGNGEQFALRIKGDSMIDAHIMDADIVLVKKQNQVNNGEIAVALIGNEATVKRFYKENNQIRLQPENRNMQPIYIEPDSEEFQILGKVTGIIRKY